MKKPIETVAAILLAVLTTILLGRLSPSLLSVFNILSWVVLYFSVENGEIAGAIMGSICGLIQDSLSLGVFGVAGLAFTVLGWLAGHVSKRVNVAPFGRSFLFLFLLTSLDIGLWILLMKFIFSRSVYSAGGAIFVQPFVTAFCVASITYLIRKKRKERI